LKNRLKSKYSFTPFAANCKERSVNFGILVTYRQKWDPINYQVGELVSTITLAPKEVRKISKKIVHKEKRSKKEVEKSIISQKEYATEKSKAEDKIINKALAKTNFSQSAEGAFKIDVVNMTSKTSFSKEAQKSSKDVKKNFHESVVKSVHEYKQERNVEVNTEESELFETSESSEIMNPNDEIPVTFLFYELQRRYRISEQIHRAMPVIFVAQEVPRPDQLDEAWLTIHSWIIRRVSLDDTIVLPALKYLSSNVAGDEVALKELRKNIEQQRRIVEELREQLIALREKSDFLNSTLELAIYQKAGLIEEPQNEGSGGGGLLSSFIDTISDTVESTIDSIKGFSPAYNLYKLSDSLLGNGDEKDRDPLDIARDAADRATKRTNELRRILESEESSLASMAGKYTRQLSDHLNRRTQISTLLAHIKQNILYYMQAIWLHEPTDQRICRLRNVKVPVLNGKKKYTFGKKMGPEVFAFDVDMEIEPNFEFTTLEEVADLNNLMGFMCNYMVFPLKGSNALTDFMLEPYKDSLYELRDPDESGNGNLLDFAKLVCCLKKNDPEKFEDEDFKSKLKEQYETLKDSYRNDSEETVIPTDSLYIEALPGEHPILENFKLLHRAIDVKKVQAEVRGEELENLRLAARLLSGEYEDPDIDKKIVVEGDTQNVTVSTDDP
jgi:hypothetical protein